MYSEQLVSACKYQRSFIEGTRRGTLTNLGCPSLVRLKNTLFINDRKMIIVLTRFL
jgi:hypothetical protein